jgi:hypothetical protein
LLDQAANHHPEPHKVQTVFIVTRDNVHRALLWKLLRDPGAGAEPHQLLSPLSLADRHLNKSYGHIVACLFYGGINAHDVEQSHFRFKQAVDQALRVCGSRDFTDRSAYCHFLAELVRQRNRTRQAAWERAGCTAP